MALKATAPGYSHKRQNELQIEQKGCANKAREIFQMNSKINQCLIAPSVAFQAKLGTMKGPVGLQEESKKAKMDFGNVHIGVP